MRAYVEGVGLVGPGLTSWQASRALLAGDGSYQFAPTAVATSELLPAAERRRAGMPVRLSLAAGEEAFAIAGRSAAETATVFASSGGDCNNVHHILEELTTPQRQVSPTRFHNSVHNAAAGYWSIATQCRAPSTSLCCHDASFAAGLLEAVSQVAVSGAPIALIAYDHPYPEPLNAVRPIQGAFGTAMVLAPHASERAVAALDVDFMPQEAEASCAANPGLEQLRTRVPAARCLPLLAALARRSRETVRLEYVAGAHLSVAVTPCS
jgi:hypothetical protein